MSVDAYGYKIEMGNRGVYKDLVHYIGMHDSTPTLEHHMEHLATLDTFLNASQLGSSFNTNTNTSMKGAATAMHSEIGVTSGTLTGSGKDAGFTRYYSGRVGHISHMCPHHGLLKMLLEQALVGKDAPNAKS
jgi:hypothetical protein